MKKIYQKMKKRNKQKRPGAASERSESIAVSGCIWWRWRSTLFTMPRDHERAERDSSAEFRRWLRKEKDKYLEDLDREDSRHYFRKFIKRWNRGDLSHRYYDGAYSAPAATSDERSSYAWGAKRVKHGPVAPDRETLQSYKRSVEKSERHRRRQDQKAVLDELAPKETGRDARLAKKAAAREDRRARQQSPEMPERDLMGSSSGEFAHLVRRERERRESRAAKRRAVADRKLNAYQEKEAARMAEIMALAKQVRTQGGWAK
ncbi:uncharacterized protein MONBRDRAFT_36210 [Monosiga brevicollis MX1]|uniref:Uncharacterized protein n=1 Tax=Monosiga brevicollis TaxID=81824 RepID=A9UTS6_MONBE|nr:uncharacterized protein MONBRDRAFT_36210 [Monosiga brevicollis MX1]EDQ91299.1 predicted protein [Monosiga brevicollis MX1]|eukprot:XP_001743721.1 hypothetical protein [Monosiga brevicollis MX1]